MRALSALCLALGIAGIAGASEGATIRFCITFDAAYRDSGIAGEDYWTDATWPSGAPKAPRGAKFNVWRNGAHVLVNSHLGDGFGGTSIGCTPLFTVSAINGTYDLSITSSGEVNGNNVVVRDEGGFLMGEADTVTVTNGQQTQYVEMTITSGDWFYVFNIYQAVAYALYRHNGGNSDDDFFYEYDENADGGAAGYKPIRTGQAERKFIIVHEVGHVMSNLSSIQNAIDYTYAEQECSEEPNPDTAQDADHSMRSKEYSGAAVAEGFAHFYAADVWNDHSASNCWFEYYKQVGVDNNPRVNCENSTSTPDFANAYLESQCDGAGSEAGLGVELDWLRAFWDVHTDSDAPAVDPTFTEIVGWLVAAGNWQTDDAFDPIDAAADARNDEIDANWNTLCPPLPQDCVLDGL